MVRHRVRTSADRQVNHIRRFTGLGKLHAKEMTSWRGFLRWHGYWIREGPYSDEAAVELLEKSPPAPEPGTDR